MMTLKADSRRVFLILGTVLLILSIPSPVVKALAGKGFSLRELAGLTGAALTSSTTKTIVETGSYSPGLTTFIKSVQNGDGSVLRGVYVEGLFGLAVVQQPTGDAGFVSSEKDVVTEFATVSHFGNVGLLAHNYLAGQYFPMLTIGQGIDLVYGNGRMEHFAVTDIQMYQAASPNTPAAKFVNLDVHETLTTPELFTKVYTGARHLTLQTCTTLGQDLSWGRLFVIAK